MRLNRVLIATSLAAIGAAVPITVDTRSPAALALSVAACDEGMCDGRSSMDCICPDQQAEHRRPRCDG